MRREGVELYIFDSFGNLRPPKELVQYLDKDAVKIEYNRTSYQKYNQSNCGQLCLRFLQTIDTIFKD